MAGQLLEELLWTRHRWVDTYAAHRGPNIVVGSCAVPKQSRDGWNPGSTPGCLDITMEGAQFCIYISCRREMEKFHEQTDVPSN